MHIPLLSFLNKQWHIQNIGFNAKYEKLIQIQANKITALTNPWTICTVPFLAGEPNLFCFPLSQLASWACSCHSESVLLLKTPHQTNPQKKHHMPSIHFAATAAHYCCAWQLFMCHQMAMEHESKQKAAGGGTSPGTSPPQTPTAAGEIVSCMMMRPTVGSEWFWCSTTNKSKTSTAI